MKEAVGIVAVHDIGRGDMRARGAPGGKQVRAGKAMHAETAELLLRGYVGVRQHRQPVAPLGKTL